MGITPTQSHGGGVQQHSVDTVAPILLREGVPATIFLNSAFVDNRALMFRYKASLLMEHLGLSGRHSGLLETSYSFAYQLDDFATRLHYDFRDFLATQKPYLTSDQIRELAAKGFTFGGHSHTHPLFADISLTDQLQQAELSVNAVQRVFAQPCRVFAFPFTGDGVGEEFFRAAPIDLAFGSGGLKTSPYKNYLQRVPMEGTHHSAAELIGAEYLYALAKQKLHNYLPNSK